MDKTSAGSYSRALQVVFGVFAAAAVVVAAAGVAHRADPAVALAEPTLPEIKIRDGAKGASASDVTGMAARIASVSNAPRVAPPPPAPTDTAKGDPIPAPPQTPEEPVKYLGAMNLGRDKVALITVSGKQRFVGLGDHVQDERVSAIDADSLELSRGEADAAASRRLEKQARSGELVTHLAAAGRPPVAGAPKGNVPGAGGGFNPGRPVTFAPARSPIPQPELPIDPDKAIGMQFRNGFTDAGQKSSAMDSVRARLKASGKFKDENELEENLRLEVDRLTREGGK